MESRNSILAIGTVLALAALLIPGGEAHAQDLVHQSQVTSFGGSAATFQVNLQLAQAQRPQDVSSFRRDPLESFQEDLQRQILGQLSRQIVQSQLGDRFGAAGGLQLDQPGTFNLGDFVLNVIPGADVLEIRVANVITGNSTTVTVPRF